MRKKEEKVWERKWKSQKECKAPNHKSKRELSNMTLKVIAELRRIYSMLCLKRVKLNAKSCYLTKVENMLEELKN